MRHLLVLFAGLCASTTTSLVVWVAISLEPNPTAPPFVEVVDESLVRTNLPRRRISLCLDDVLQTIASESDPTNTPSHVVSGDAWYAKAGFLGCTEERTSRFDYRLPGVEGAPLKVEVIAQADAATMVFVEHDSREAVRRTAGLLAKRLQDVIAEGK